MLTPKDYENIQRMIDTTLLHGLGWSPDGDINVGSIAAMEDLNDVRVGLENDISSQVSDVQHDVNRLETAVCDLERDSQ